MTAVLAKGWGYVIEIRLDPTTGCHQALVLFADEEAPRWTYYAALNAHRRQLIAARSQQPTTG